MRNWNFFFDRGVRVVGSTPGFNEEWNNALSSWFIFFALLMLSAEICSAEIQFEGEFRSLLYLQNDQRFRQNPFSF